MTSFIVPPTEFSPESVTRNESRDSFYFAGFSPKNYLPMYVAAYFDMVSPCEARNLGLCIATKSEIHTILQNSYLKARFNALIDADKTGHQIKDLPCVEVEREDMKPGVPMVDIHTGEQTRTSSMRVAGSLRHLYIRYRNTP